MCTVPLAALLSQYCVITILLLPSAELESQRKQAELDKKSYDDLLRERDILSKVCARVTPQISVVA